MTIKENKQTDLLEVWNQLCELFFKAKLINSKMNKSTFAFNQITLNRTHNICWEAAEVLLKDLSIEETKLLLDLSKTNVAPINTHLKINTALWITGPSFLIYITYQLVQYFGTESGHVRGAIYGAIAILIYAALLFPFFIGRVLVNKWRNTEMTTCLESIIVLKKAAQLKNSIGLEIPIDEDVHLSEKIVLEQEKLKK